MTKVFWLFGRSGAGKTTLAKRLYHSLNDRKIRAFYLDGDEMRSSLCSDLGFAPESRIENHRRIAEVAKLAAKQGLNPVVSTMAPQRSQRDIVAQVLKERLVWIYIHAPLEVCIQRDPKGLYNRVRTGQLDKLLNYPFDVPRPHEQENYINTVTLNVDGCTQAILELAKKSLSNFTI